MRSWISWALRKSSNPASAAATARRCRVGRTTGRWGWSVLVIVLSVYGVTVAVVDVVDVVAVGDGGVAAVLTVLVGVLVGGAVRGSGDLGERCHQPAAAPQPHAQ